MSVFVVLFEHDGWHVAAEPGRIFGWNVRPLAAECAHRLEERGLHSFVLSRSLTEIGDLLHEHGLDETAFELIESQTLSRDDAASWSRELADRIADLVLGGDEAA